VASSPRSSRRCRPAGCLAARHNLHPNAPGMGRSSKNTSLARALDQGFDVFLLQQEFRCTRGVDYVPLPLLADSVETWSKLPSQLRTANRCKWQIDQRAPCWWVSLYGGTYDGEGAPITAPHLTRTQKNVNPWGFSGNARSRARSPVTHLLEIHAKCDGARLTRNFAKR
jgi:hypothetical protein